MSVRIAISPSERFEILTRDKFTCRYCGRKSPNVELHVDHIHPVAKGGTNSPENLCAACVECNLSKKDKLIGKHLPMPADDAPLNERVAHLRLEMKRRFHDYDGKVPSAAFSSALESGRYSLSNLIQWFDENQGRLRFIDAVVHMASFGSSALEKARFEADAQANHSFTWKWADALCSALEENHELIRRCEDAELVDHGSWSVAVASIYAEACHEEGSGEVSYALYNMLLRALVTGVSRQNLLDVGPRRFKCSASEIICAIADLTEDAMLQPRPEPSTHLTLVPGGAE